MRSAQGAIAAASYEGRDCSLPKEPLGPRHSVSVTERHPERQPAVDAERHSPGMRSSVWPQCWQEPGEEAPAAPVPPDLPPSAIPPWGLGIARGPLLVCPVLLCSPAVVAGIRGVLRVLRRTPAKAAALRHGMRKTPAQPTTRTAACQQGAHAAPHI